MYTKNILVTKVKSPRRRNLKAIQISKDNSWLTIHNTQKQAHKLLLEFPTRSDHIIKDRSHPSALFPYDSKNCQGKEVLYKLFPPMQPQKEERV